MDITKRKTRKPPKAITDEAAQTRYREAMEFLHRTLKFIRENKRLHATKTREPPLGYREMVDTIEERIETHLNEWEESSHATEEQPKRG